MKKICFFSGDITREGGTERVAVMIANELAKQKKYQILFLSLVEQKEQPFFRVEPTIKRYALGDKWIQPGPGYIGVIPKLRRFIKEQKVDVLIDIDIVLDVLSIPARTKLGTKVISWEHFNYFYEQETLYRRLILKYSVKHTDYIVTLTEEDKECYKTYLNRGKNIRAIYNPMVRQITDTIGEKEKWLITVGRLIHRKGTDYLATVATKVLKDNPEWRWIVLGDGEDRPLLETAIKENGLQDHLILKGTVSNVDAYLDKAQIFVMTSRVEGLPMCLLEAQTHKLPCVSFDIQTGPKEIIDHGVNGYLVKAFDCEDMATKIQALIQDSQLKEQFANNTRKNMKKFQIEHILKCWNEVFDNL